MASSIETRRSGRSRLNAGKNLMSEYDVVVVGAGNAACCAALAAAEHGARVLVLERASQSESGGNSRFTAGAIRFAYDGVDDLVALMPDLYLDVTALWLHSCRHPVIEFERQGALYI